MTASRTVRCAECGTAFETRSPRAKFCPDRPACRKAASRRPSRQGRRETAEAVDLRPPQVDGDLVDQIRTSLEKAGALETIAGASALLLARQMERGQESGSAVASMTKELSRLVGAAKAEAGPQQRDAADDVMARAAAKLMRLVEGSASTSRRSTANLVLATTTNDAKDL